MRSCLSRRNTLEQLQSPYRFSQQERIGEIRQYYRDAAKARRLPCPAGSNLMVRIDLVDEQFGDLLKRLQLPENWCEIIRRNMVAQALAAGVTPETVEREKERLKLKESRTIKLYKEGYTDEEEFQGEMAAVELALKQLDAPEVEGVTYGEVIEAGEHLPGMAALWDVATVEERYEMVTIVLEPGGLYYDLENKIVAAIKPRPAFLPVLRMLNGVMEFDETRGLLVTEHWCERNRRVSVSLSPTLTLFQTPHGKLYLRLQERVPESESVRLAASHPPKTMASSIEIPDALIQTTNFPNGYPK